MVMIELLSESSAAAHAPAILVVEDETRIRTVMAEILATEGYIVLESPTAEHALAHPGSSIKDLALLITDVILPGKTGRQLAHELGMRVPGIKTILVSGYGENVAFLGEERNDRTSYLPKPFSSLSLLRAVRGMLAGTPALDRGGFRRSWQAR